MDLGKIEAEAIQRDAAQKKRTEELVNRNKIQYKNYIMDVYTDKKNPLTIEFTNYFASKMPCNSVSGTLMTFNDSNMNLSNIPLPGNERCKIVAEVFNNLGGVKGFPNVGL